MIGIHLQSPNFGNKNHHPTTSEATPVANLPPFIGKAIHSPRILSPSKAIPCPLAQALDAEENRWEGFVYRETHLLCVFFCCWGGEGGGSFNCIWGNLCRWLIWIDLDLYGRKTPLDTKVKSDGRSKISWPVSQFLKVKVSGLGKTDEKHHHERPK